MTVELRRLLWGGLAAVLALGALAGLVGVISGDRFTERHVRILATAWLALLCGAALLAGLRLLEQRTFFLFGATLAAAAPVAFVLFALPIWDHDRETLRWGQIVLSTLFLILSGLILASLRLAVEARDRIVLAVVFAVALALAVVDAIALYYIWSFPEGEEGTPGSLVDYGGRLLVALFVLAVLGYLLAPIVERLRRPPTRSREQPTSSARTGG